MVHVLLLAAGRGASLPAQDMATRFGHFWLCAMARELREDGSA